MYRELMQTIAAGKALSTQQVEAFLSETERGKLNIAQQAAMLSGLNTKGITAAELSAFQKHLSQQMPEDVTFPDAIDICGTGGSGLSRINTSTISAFILSALGVSVAKHGNKAASGRFGSFDLLEKMGINIDLGKKELERLGQQVGLCFLYARSFHPVMKHFAAVRKDIGIPTVFNLLGPLLNPAQSKMQIIGTSFEDQMELIAQTAKKIGKKRVMVVRGEDGLDEVTLTGKTRVLELKDGKIRSYTLKPESFGVKRCSFADIQGGSGTVNTKIALEILEGTCKSRHLDLVLVNTALALKLAGKYSNLKKGYAAAKACVESGRAYQQYLSYRQASHAPSILLDIVGQKRKEVEARKKKLPLKKLVKKVQPSQRDFRRALARSGMSLIAEVKQCSPSSGKIVQGSFNPAQQARIYEQAGARSISVLTDKTFFGGDLKHLMKVEEVTSMTPLLCKDFIIDEYQIYEARYAGADAILLIAALLTSQQMQYFLNIARTLNMDCLCEVHDEEELKRVLKTDADIIGINNRNLHTFKIDLKTTQKLAKKIKGKIVVCESGIASKGDIKKLPKNVVAILVGTTLMKSKDPKATITKLIGKPKPLLKICGVQSVREAQHCQKLGVDMIGLNFVPSSQRRISFQLAKKIISTLRKKSDNGTQIVGVFQDQPVGDVNSALKNLDLDFVQLSGKEPLSYIKKVKGRVIKGVSILNKRDVQRAEKLIPHVSHVLFDGKEPGSGQAFNHGLAKGFSKPFLLAGGITPENVEAFVQLVEPLGVDLASGVETNGKRDLKKISQLVTLLS